MPIFRLSKPILDVRKIEDRVLFLSDGLYELKEDYLKTVLKFKANQISGGWQFSTKPYGLKISNADSFEVESLVDLQANTLELKEEHIKGIKSGCYSIFDEDDFKEILISNSSGNRIEIENPSSLDWYTDCILARSDEYSNVQCFDFELNLKWCLKLDDINDADYFGPCGKVYEYGDVFIFYAGVCNDSSRVLAIAKGSGKILWEFSFIGRLTSLYQFEGLTCLAVSGKMLELDSQYGDLVNEIETGLTEEPYQSFVRNEDLLFFTSFKRSEVKIFSEDSKEELSTIKLPEPFTSDRLQLPVCTESDFYLQLSGKYPHQVYTTFGLFTLNNKQVLECGNSIDITFESKPNSSVETLSTGDSEEYVITFSEAEFDLFERYFELEVLKIASEFASQPHPSSNVNSRFNGKITVSVPSKYSAGCDREKLDESVERLSEQLQYFSAGSNDIQISIVFQ